MYKKTDWIIHRRVSIPSATAFVVWIKVQQNFFAVFIGNNTANLRMRDPWFVDIMHSVFLKALGFIAIGASQPSSKTLLELGVYLFEKELYQQCVSLFNVLIRGYSSVESPSFVVVFSVSTRQKAVAIFCCEGVVTIFGL